MFNELLENLLKEDDFDDIFQPASEEEADNRLINHIKSMCTENEDGTYSCDGDIELAAMGLTELPVKFKVVKGNFDCSHNYLTSLKGCPEGIEELYCHSNELTLLDGCPDSLNILNCGRSEADILPPSFRPGTNIH